MVESACRKSRVEVDNAAPSESPEAEENPLHRFDMGMPDMAPTSPSQASVDAEHGQHMPHLLCMLGQLPMAATDPPLTINGRSIAGKPHRLR